MLMTHSRLLAGVALFVGSIACGESAQEEATGSAGEDYGDESYSTSLDAMTAVAGQKATVIAKSGLNLRRQPTTASSVIVAMPSGSVVDVLAKQGSWFSVRYASQLGWAFGAYLEGRSGGSSGGGSGGGGDSGGGGATSDMMARARSGVGFSYHWGGGCWDPESSAVGACYGSCPSCKHQGRWGADCSGYVAKVWQVPRASAVTECSHPYSSRDFYSRRDHWQAVSRSSARTGDAFVRNGHIFLYNSGDAWGSIRSYEAKACSAGIVYNSRTADSSYRVIRRN